MNVNIRLVFVLIAVEVLCASCECEQSSPGGHRRHWSKRDVTQIPADGHAYQLTDAGGRLLAANNVSFSRLRQLCTLDFISMKVKKTTAMGPDFVPCTVGAETSGHACLADLDVAITHCGRRFDEIAREYATLLEDVVVSSEVYGVFRNCSPTEMSRVPHAVECVNATLSRRHITNPKLDLLLKVTGDMFHANGKTNVCGAKALIVCESCTTVVWKKIHDCVEVTFAWPQFTEEKIN